MRFGRYLVALAAVAGACCSITALADGLTHSFGPAPGEAFASATNTAHEAHGTEMGTRLDSDGLGTQLPANFDKDKVIKQIAKGKNPDLIVLTGVVPWPEKPGRFLAIACLALDDEQLKFQHSSRIPGECHASASGEEHDFDEIFLGIYETGKDGKPMLLARNHDVLEGEVSWDNTNLQAPDVAQDDTGSGPSSGSRTLTPQTIRRFDLAPYEIHKGDYAFGLRVGWRAAYAAGGAADFEALVLFEQVGDDVRPIFAQPVMAQTKFAGDWRKDGTRDYDVSNTSNVLVVLESETHGYRDIELHERKGTWKKSFVWSQKDEAYVPR